MTSDRDCGLWLAQEMPECTGKGRSIPSMHFDDGHARKWLHTDVMVANFGRRAPGRPIFWLAWAFFARCSPPDVVRSKGDDLS